MLRIGRSHFVALTLTNSAVSHRYEGKHQPHPQTEVEVEGVDAMDGDEAEDSGQVTQGLQGEEEQVDKQLDKWDDPPVTWEAQVILNKSTHTIIRIRQLILMVWNKRVLYHFK